jgi:heme/copper-type cytochrome/quinol oxidase subunit 3
MKARTFIRILLTIAIVVVTSLIFIIFVSIAGTSHHDISAESRNNAITRGFLTIGLGIVFVVVVWVPWGQIIKRWN